MGLLGLLCIPMSSALHDFSVRQQINSQFAGFKAGLVQQSQHSGVDVHNLRRIRMLYSNVRVVNNNASGAKTYMNMAEGGVGLGLGAKDYRIVMIFHKQSAINYFIEHGWTAGGNADATAKAGSKGASVEGEGYLGDVTVYTMTESGLALQATVKGTKFWVDDELN